MSIERKRYLDQELYVSNQWDILWSRWKLSLEKVEWDLGKEISIAIMEWWDFKSNWLDIIKKYTRRWTKKGNGQLGINLTVVKSWWQEKPKEKTFYIGPLVAELFPEHIDSEYSGKWEMVLSYKDGDSTNTSVNNLIWSNKWKNGWYKYIFGTCILTKADIRNLASLYSKTNNLEKALKQSWVRDHISVKWKLPDSYRERIQTLISK